MVKDAELHADEDRKAKELVEARNQADALIHASEKSVKELGEDKIDAAEKEAIEKTTEELKEAIKGDDKEAIEQKTQALAEASAKVAEKLYAQKTAETEAATSEQGKSDDVVDAEFEEVKEKKEG